MKFLVNSKLSDKLIRQKMTIKIYRSVLLAIIIILTLCACGNSTDKEATGKVNLYKDGEVVLTTTARVFVDDLLNNPLDNVPKYRVHIKTELSKDYSDYKLYVDYKGYTYIASPTTENDGNKEWISAYTFELYGDSPQDILKNIYLQFK